MKKLFHAIWVEIKNTIFQSVFHMIRFGGLLLMPLVYGFSYIFAFYNPFEHTEKLPIAVITQQYSEENSGISSAFEKSLGKEFEKTSSLKTGDLEMDIKMKHVEIPSNIYGNEIQEKINDINKDYYASFYLPPIKQDKTIQDLVTSIISQGQITPGNDAFNKIKMIVDSFRNNEKIQINNNFKKNYLISFGIDIGTSMFGGGEFIAKKIVSALEGKDFIRYLQNSKLIKTDVQLTRYKEVVGKIKNIVNRKSTTGEDEHFSPIKVNSQMGEKAMYGYGLAPFFISVAMWIGAMVMTFAVHKKVYDQSALPGVRYFAKWVLINVGVVVQATLLIGSLYFIGFDKLGPIHIWSLYWFTIFVGVIFSAVIQAIRFLIPNRNLGIFITIILLVLQMTSSGGLFPIETQNSFYKTLHNFLPMSHSVALFREVSFDTHWDIVLLHVRMLAIYLIIIPLAVYANHHQTIRMYEENGWQLPEKILIRRQKHRAKLKETEEKYGDKDA